MHRLYGGLIAWRGLVLVLALALVAAGWLNLRHLAVDAVPDISPKQVLILTEAANLGPLEVERLVTIPIETQMVGLPHLQDVRSTSRFGLAAVYVTFDDSADVQAARAQVFERLQLARQMMPPGVGQPQEGPFATGLGEILEFELRGPGYTPMQLYQMLQWQIVPYVRLAPGIANVDIYGGQLETFQITASPDRLREHGLSIPDLYAAVEANNAARGGAYIERGDEQEIVRGLALARTRQDIANIVLRASPAGTPVTVGDVAEVRMAPKARLGAVTHDGTGETIVGVAEMQYGLNSSEVLPALKARLAEIQQRLPPGVQIQTFYDRSELIQRAIRTVAHNLVEGALLVVGVLLLALGNLRAGLIVASVIPLSMMIAFAGMRAFGISANLMSLGAIDFGLIVDGAVVLIENVLHRQSENPKESDPRRVVPDAAAEVTRPVVFSIIIITAVYLPVLTLQSVEGKTFRPMALTVMLALVGALLTTLIVVPALAASCLGARPQSGDTFLIRITRRFYTPLLRRAIAHRWITLSLAAGAFVGSLLTATTLGAQFIPRLAEGAIIVTSNKLPSINLDASIRVVTAIEKIIRGFPDVQTVVSQTGSAAVPTDPMGVQSTDSYVILKPPGQWRTAGTQQGIEAAIEARLKAAIPGVQFEFSQPIQMRMDDLLQGVRTDVALDIFGPDQEKLQSLATQAVQAIRKLPNAQSVRAEQLLGLPDLTVAVDREKLARFGLRATDVLAAVEAIGGHQVGEAYGDDNSETPIIVRLMPGSRANIEVVRNIPVGLAGGAAIPLSAVADIAVKDGAAQVLRDQLRRRISIDVDASGSNSAGFARQAQQAVGRALHLPAGYTLEWNGRFQNLQSAAQRLELVVPIVLAVIFLLLYVNFGSLRPAAAIFLNVPMAASGGIVALLLRGMPFSVTALIGFISVFGVTILDGVVLVSFIESERRQGKNAAEAAQLAAERRLRPVLTTALVATIGFLPMAVSTSVGAAVQRPLATVVIGGLLIATLLTLLVLPTLYPLIADFGLAHHREANPKQE